MRTKWLFPHRYRLIGWLIFGFAFVHGLPFLMGDAEKLTALNLIKDALTRLPVYQYAYTDEIVAIGIILGLLLIAFSREKVEDEMISQLRLEALQWSVYANYLILTVAILAVYDLAFIDVMVYNMFTVLLVFVGRFRWLIYRNNHRLAA